MWCTGVTETVDLLQVKTRKGFSHRGRLNSGIKVPTSSFSLNYEQLTLWSHTMQLETMTL